MTQARVDVVQWGRTGRPLRATWTFVALAPASRGQIWRQHSSKVPVVSDFR